MAINLGYVIDAAYSSKSNLFCDEKGCGAKFITLGTFFLQLIQKQ
jgi:hypothetical protein